MSGFTKLDSSLTLSSMWDQPDSVRVIWITLLSLADKNGDVKGSIRGLAHLSRKSVAETEAALDVFMAPDPDSGRKDLHGQRVTLIEGGWHLVTHPYYRESGMTEAAKEYWREKKKEQRKRPRHVRDSPRHVGDGLGMGVEKDEPEIKEW